MSTEIPGMRESRAEMRRRMRDAGLDEAHIEKHLDGMVRRSHRRIRAGKNPKPTYRGERLEEK